MVTRAAAQGRTGLTGDPDQHLGDGTGAQGTGGRHMRLCCQEPKNTVNGMTRVTDGIVSPQAHKLEPWPCEAYLGVGPLGGN